MPGSHRRRRRDESAEFRSVGELRIVHSDWRFVTALVAAAKLHYIEPG